jgi:hypothetical protein
MDKTNIVGRGMTQNMERLKRGEIGEDRNRKLKGVVKGGQKREGVKGDRARNSDPKN